MTFILRKEVLQHFSDSQNPGHMNSYKNDAPPSYDEYLQSVNNQGKICVNVFSIRDKRSGF